MVISLVLHESTQLQTISCQIHDTGKNFLSIILNVKCKNTIFIRKSSNLKPIFTNHLLVSTNLFSPFVFISRSLFIFPFGSVSSSVVFLPWSRFSFKGANLVCRA